MEEVFIIGIIFYFTYLVFSLFARRRERLMLIEKISELKDVKLGNIQLGGAGKYAWLHVGCCACGIGLGLLIAFFIELNVRYTNIDIYKCMKHFQKHRKINMEQSTFVKSPRSGRVKVGLKRRRR